MKYLVYDCEYATSKGGIKKICEFGYIITNEKFEVLERNNLIINPNITRAEWNYYVVRKILTRKIEEYEKSPKFDAVYQAITSLFNQVDYVVGHTIESDAEALNQECQRYSLPSIDYDFYDVKEYYKEYNNSNNSTSVVNMLKELNIEGDEAAHDAEADAYNTMLELKRILELLQVSFDELNELAPHVKSITKDYIIPALEKRREEEALYNKDLLLNNNSKNLSHKIMSGKIELLCDNMKVQLSQSQFLKGNNVSLGLNLIYYNFDNALKMIQLIHNEGGKYQNSASGCDYVIDFPVQDENGEWLEDKKIEFSKKLIEDGNKIKILSIQEFLNLVQLNEEEFSLLPSVTFDFALQNDAIVNSERVQKIIKKAKNERPVITKVYRPDETKTTLGELFGDLLNNMKDTH